MFNFIYNIILITIMMKMYLKGIVTINHIKANYFTRVILTLNLFNLLN